MQFARRNLIAGGLLAASASGTKAATSGTSGDAGQQTGITGVLDAGSVNFTPAGKDAVNRTMQAKARDHYDARDWGANPASSADQTAVIQIAVDDLSNFPDSELNVPRGVKCSYRDLDFTTNHRITLKYIVDDELNQEGYVGLGSGEPVTLIVRSGFPTDATGGYVGEGGIEAPLHAAIYAETRPEMRGVSSGLGQGQTLYDPVRVSWLLRQTKRGLFAATAINHALARSEFSGTFLRNYHQRYTLTGVGTSAWVTPPAVGASITTSGGGKGFVLAIDASTMTVEWSGGTFIVGQTMGDANESGKGPITVVVLAIKEMSPLSQSLRTGRWAIDLAPGNARAVLDVGGDIGVQPTQTFGQRVESDVTVPGFAWRRTIAATVGASVRQHPSENEKRLWVYDRPTEAGTARGMLGAVCASVAFATAALTSKAINVASIAMPATGNYIVTFVRPMASAEYSVQISMSSLMSRPTARGTFYTVGYESLDVASVQIRVSLVDLAARTVTAANIPAGAQVSLTVIGGDI